MFCPYWLLKEHDSVECAILCEKTTVNTLESFIVTNTKQSYPKDETHNDIHKTLMAYIIIFKHLMASFGHYRIVFTMQNQSEIYCLHGQQ